MLGLALLGAACNKNPGQQTAKREERRPAFVRVVNAMPGGLAMDILVEDQKVFPEVKPGSLAPYREVPEGLTTFRARWTGRDSDSSAADNREILRQGNFSTIILRPASGRKEVEMTILKDHTWLPDTGRAKCESFTQFQA